MPNKDKKHDPFRATKIVAANNVLDNTLDLVIDAGTMTAGFMLGSKLDRAKTFKQKIKLLKYMSPKSVAKAISTPKGKEAFKLFASQQKFSIPLGLGLTGAYVGSAYMNDLKHKNDLPSKRAEVEFFEEEIEKEANLLSEPDINYKVEDFLNGKENVVWVPGYSGSGKSYFSKNFAKENGAHHIEMDDFGKKTDSNPNHPIVKQFLESRPDIKKKLTRATAPLYEKEYIDFAMDYAKKHPDEKFVFEGIQLTKNTKYDVPRIVKGTGAIKSSQQGMARNMKTPIKRFVLAPPIVNSTFVPKINDEKVLVDSLKAGKSMDEVKGLLKKRSRNRKLLLASYPAAMVTGYLGGHEGTANHHKQASVSYWEEEIEKVAFDLDPNDNAYDLEDFLSGKKNAMFLSGYSGAGKSTTTKALKTETGAHHIELDDFMNFKDSNPDLPLRKMFLDDNPSIKRRINKLNVMNYYPQYVDYAVQYAKRHPEQKFILEGIQTVGNMDHDIPRLVKGTDAITSTIRAGKRNLKEGRIPSVVNIGMVGKMNKEKAIVDHLRLGRDYSEIQKILKKRRMNKALIAASIPASAMLAYRAGKNEFKEGRPEANTNSNQNLK